MEGEAKIAWAQEEMSLHGLNILLKQAVEAISFVLLLSDYKITDIVAKWVDCCANRQNWKTNHELR